MILNPYRFGGGPRWDSATVSSPHVLSDSDRRLTQPTSNTSIAKTPRGSRGMSSGKWYWEVHVNSVWNGAGGTSGLGMVDSTFDPATDNLLGDTNANCFGFWINGTVWRSGGAVLGGLGGFGDGNVVRFAFDADAGDVWAAVNTSWLIADPTGSPLLSGLSTSETYYPAACPWSSSPTEAVIFDIRGRGNTAYSPPSGFTAYRK